MTARTRLPRHDGWTIERVVPLLGGSVVLGSLALGRGLSPRWRGLTAFAGGNLVMYAAVGWCPMSLLLQKLGVTRLADTNREHRTPAAEGRTP
ncbi:DUF2892 domain-containing protein [Rhodococcus sp. HNM0569]|uniref:YgaP family membrane protein n=1 Tax=Rhodococcus sp. HNM0569 TaxID=2716340 RepID=UPI00146B4902|nr:DUF2892 domain-containing protein [Rhodococcus sp. HNM0569]NLU85109.1 DUF2892 domain-containing protein [Rhodococcus sp. HNM0569]